MDLGLSPPVSHRILRWLLDFWKICGYLYKILAFSMLYFKIFMKLKSRDGNRTTMPEVLC
jgi:hypothetical protein